MRLSNKMVEAINQQITNELHAAYQYLALVAWFEDANLDGFAHWMRVQHAEEQAHALKFFNFLLDHDAPVKLGAIAAPRGDYTDPIAVFKAVLQQEEQVTGQVFDLYELAMSEKAWSAKVMLEWFISEQVEEEKIARTVLERLEMIGDNKAALLVLDQEMAGRSEG